MKTPTVPAAPARPAAALAAVLAILALGLSGCSTTRAGYPRPAKAVAAGAEEQAVRFVAVYVVHGDADYVYHDKAGRRRLADEDALAQAQEVGRNALAAEVFVFHQRPRWHLWRKPAPDGMAYHYRRGALVAQKSYSRAGGSDFAAEAALFEKWAAPGSLPRKSCPAASALIPGASGGDTSAIPRVIPEPVRFFVYFGHEIPLVGGRGYSRSHPDDEFSLARFARGLERFAGPPCTAPKPYAMVVLSTCRGGTPSTTTALFPYADWLLASPGDLHLSFLDTRALIPMLSTAGSEEAWTAEPRRIRLEAGAGRMLRESFGRLGERTETPITLALYESGPASAYLEGRPNAWEPGGELARGIRMSPLAWRDCADDPGFGEGGEKAGTTVLYRPGRFGLLKAKNAHSGWECPQPAATDWIGERQAPPDPAPEKQNPPG